MIASLCTPGNEEVKQEEHVNAPPVVCQFSDYSPC